MNEELQFILKAVDEASGTLAQVKTATENLAKEFDTASASVNNYSQNAKNAQTTNENLSTSIFKGVATWDILKAAIQKTVQFVEQSAEQYLVAQQKLDLARAIIDSTGQSFEKVGPQIQDFGNKMGALGLSTDDATLAAAKLTKAVGGDVAKGLELAKMAADLTASGYQDLNSNVESLTRVIVGKGQREMVKFGLNMSETATTAEQLAAIQGKVTQTVEQFGDTVPGRVDAVNEAFNQLKESVGRGLFDAFQAATKESGVFNDALDGINTVAKILKTTIFEVSSGLAAIGQTAQVVGTGLGSLFNIAEAAGNALHGNFSAAAEELNATLDLNSEKVGNLMTTVGNMIDPTKAMTKAEAELADQAKKTGAAHVALSSDFQNTNAAASSSTAELKKAIDSMKLKYSELTSSATLDLADLADAHRKEADSIADSIAKTQRAINDLNRSYSQQQTSDTASVADKIVASEQKVADLKKQIAAETVSDKRDQLVAQLKEEQANLDSSQEFTKNNQAAIEEARRRASLTDLQRTIEDYNSRRAIAAQEYSEKLQQLNQELADQKAKQAAELALYTERTAKIKDILTAANKDYVDASKARLQQTTDEVNAEIALFQRLAAAISAAKSASASGIGSVSVPTASVSGKRATGGAVTGGSMYLVGEKGPEMFMPANSGSIVPNGAIGGSQVIINIEGMEISAEAANKVSDIIVSRLRRISKIGL